MAKISSYKSKVYMQLNAENDITIIPTASVLSIVIDSSFEIRMMPIIYVTLNVETEIYNKIVKHRNDGRIYLNVRYYDANVSIPFYKNRIKGQFIYFPPSQYDYRTIIQGGNSNVDNSYNKMVLGLISADLLNFNSTTFNGNYRNISTENLLKVVTSGRDFIMDDIDKNEIFSNFYFPPITNRSDAIRYVYGETDFYNRDYIYFNDFDTSYLLKIDSRKKSDHNIAKDVIFRINKINVADAFYEGMEIKKDSYIVYLNGSNVEYNENDIMDKISTQIISVSDDSVSNIDLDIMKNESLTAKKTYRRSSSDDAESIKSIYETSDVSVNIVKPNLDGSLFTPNVTFKVDNANEHDSKYNGIYNIMYKKEVIMKQDNQYNNVIIVGFRKLKE